MRMPNIRGEIPPDKHMHRWPTLKRTDLRCACPAFHCIAPLLLLQKAKPFSCCSESPDKRAGIVLQTNMILGSSLHNNDNKAQPPCFKYSGKHIYAYVNPGQAIELSLGSIHKFWFVYGPKLALVFFRVHKKSLYIHTKRTKKNTRTSED